MKLLQTIKEKRQQLIRFLFGSFSATALMFAFQACYGPPPSEERLQIFGVVTDAETQEPVEGIAIGFLNGMDMRDTTDYAGTFGGDPVYIIEFPSYQASLWDTDSTEHGLYEAKTVTLSYEDLHAPIQLTVNRVHEDE